MVLSCFWVCLSWLVILCCVLVLVDDMVFFEGWLCVLLYFLGYSLLYLGGYNDEKEWIYVLSSLM